MGEKYQVLIPLIDFHWNGNELKIPNLGVIRSTHAPPKLPERSEYGLSKFDKDVISSTKYWLFIEQSSSEKTTTSVKANLFLLALWLVLPTKTHVRYRFEFDEKLRTNRMQPFVRILQRFEWIEGQVNAGFDTEHLEKVSAFYARLTEIYRSKHSRLRDSMILTFQGCTAHDWQVAFICFSASAECILNYKKGYGITERLSKSFACITQKGALERKKAFSDFYHSYNIRSDIMHGRVSQALKPSIRLKELAKFSNMLRELWRTILLSEVMIAEIQKDDASRDAWFRKIETDFIIKPE